MQDLVSEGDGKSTIMQYVLKYKHLSYFGPPWQLTISYEVKRIYLYSEIELNYCDRNPSFNNKHYISCENK